MRSAISALAKRQISFIYDPPAASPLAAVMRNAPSAERMLAAILTLAGAESIRETWVGGDRVHEKIADSNLYDAE